MTGTVADDKEMRETVQFLIKSNPRLLYVWKKNLAEGKYADEADKAHLERLIRLASQ